MARIVKVGKKVAQQRPPADAQEQAWRRDQRQKHGYSNMAEYRKSRAAIPGSRGGLQNYEAEQERRNVRDERMGRRTPEPMDKQERNARAAAKASPNSRSYAAQLGRWYEDLDSVRAQENRRLDSAETRMRRAISSKPNTKKK